MDGLLQPRIGGLYHGVSRQAHLQRSPSQMQELDNFLPSVDYAGFLDRPGTQLVGALSSLNYAATGHHFFRTSDGQRWVLLRRVEYGTIEVRNADTGALATLTVGAYATNYIANATASLRFLTISDTTLILNTDVAVTPQFVAAPALTTAYLVVKKVSTAAQTFSATCASGVATWALPANSNVTRDFVALGLANNIAANMPGISSFRVAGNVIRVTGSAALIASFMYSNDWDETASLLIKGSVSAITDLPPQFEGGVPIKVDLGQGDTKSTYYVQYDPARNAWVESTYLPTLSATSGSWYPGAMPMRLHQTTANGFELVPCDWVARKVGDDDSNPWAGFANQRISAMAQWKGRLWFASNDAIYSSQADDLFNFWRESAREVLPADPVTLPIETQDVANIEWLMGFRSKLMVLCDNAQLEVPGDKAVTPTDAVIGVATRYQLDGDCEPDVIGDALYYAGPMAGRSALWEYQYEQATDNNTATDLGKHVPGYVPGHVRRIRGASQSGRVYLWADGDPSRLYMQTSYWKDQERAQNAWSKLTFAGVDSILSHWVYEDTLYIAGIGHSQLVLLRVKIEAGLGEDMVADKRLDFATPVQVSWNVARQRSEVIYPAGYSQVPNLIVLIDEGDGWYREYSLTTVWDGQQWLGHFPQKPNSTSGFIGLRYARTATFSPFYPSVDEKTTPLGRLQVNRVVVDAMVSCDFVATVTRPDRIPMVTAVSPRMVDSVPVPQIAKDVSFSVPFNSKGDVGSLTLTTTSTGPLCVTGLTLEGRYTNARK
ncbi:hypothetical protein QTI51_09575 [Variovorax sp. J22G73]|uniref:phage nozzle protein n=1 Tax=unclassified Variovorax TaxID=663243 RepID=UPI002575B7A4|nr:MULTISPECIES: hypothetical protein [unclassified Variovorax]MDM0006451.1 hypothetical protein [Variovorax sp. J22R203]MDM0097526.1 hypothetical protein [Variovorax sp. J22G73]